MTASTMCREVAGRSGEKAETSQVSPVCSKIKQSLPTTAILACDFNSVLAKLGNG